MAVLGLLGGPTNATAATILFDTEAPLFNAGGAFNSRATVAGQFTVEEKSTLTGAGIYVLSADPARPDLTGWDGTLEYFLYSNLLGHNLPDTLLASGNAEDVVPMDTGVSTGDFGNIWHLQFAFETDFGVNGRVRYWLGVHTSSTYNLQDDLVVAFLANGAPEAQDFLGNGEFFRFNNGDPSTYIAMLITGDLGCDRDCHPPDVAPEPGTLALLGLGLLGLGVTRRRS